MYWQDIVSSVKSGRKARRAKWKPGQYVRYELKEKRYYFTKKHKEKPWSSHKNELTDADDWTLL